MKDPRAYDDGIPVPHRNNRCTSTDVEEREINHTQFTHLCKIEAGHSGKHKCICSRVWDPKVDANV